MEYKIGMLVENWARGFGRVVDIINGMYIVVEWSYIAKGNVGKQIYYSLDEANKYLKVHEEG